MFPEENIIAALKKLATPGHSANDLIGLGMWLMGQFDKIYIPTIHLPKGTQFFRIRPNYGSPSFSKITDITYKNANSNTEFGRAHLPNTTIFYGTLALAFQNNDGIDFRIPINTSLSEVFKELIKDDGETVTISLWRSMKKIKLTNVLYENNSINNKFYLKAFRNRLNKAKDHQESTNIILKFFSDEFSKSNINNHVDYLFSALFTENILQFTKGILYPSVRDGVGINVAIDKDFVDKYLFPYFVWEGTAYEKDGLYRFVAKKEANLIYPDREFRLKNIEYEE